MALSDEDYGILLNSVDEQKLSEEAYHYIWFSEYHPILVEYPKFDKQRYLDLAAFIILSEGRELP